jgi:hypothetical protein
VSKRHQASPEGPAPATTSGRPSEPVDALETQIDTLYALPPTEFTAARNALAKTLKGDAAARVKKLEKPGVVPAAINQLVWHDRRAFDRLMRAGRELRQSQIAALERRTGSSQAASAEHRAALAAATAAALTAANSAGLRPAADAVSRMLETISLAGETPAHPGRYVDVVQPAGFEALLGVSPSPAPPLARHAPASTAAVAPQPVRTDSPLSKAAERQRLLDEAAARRKAAEEALARADRQLVEATTAEEQAKRGLDMARQQLTRAETTLAKAREVLAQATSARSAAESALAEHSRAAARRDR